MATCAALTNSDILNLIFKHFDSNDPREDLPAWARAARVRVAFHEPAIRLLWRKLDSVIPLLSLLPSSLTRLKEVHESEGKMTEYDAYMLNGNEEPHEWERMRRHAEHVQTLSLTRPQPRVALTTWVYLSHMLQSCPLLPNLRRLSCELESPQSTVMIGPLLSSSIIRLNITCDPKSNARQWEYCLRSLFKIVCSVATHLTRIDFTTGSTRQNLPLPTSIFSPIQRLKFLRVVSLRMSSDIDFESLRSVFFGMRSLEAVNFVNWHITDHLVDRGPQLGTPGLTLDNLHTLSVANLAPSMDVKFYHCFSAPYLRVLRNHFHRFGTVGESVATFSSIARCFPCLQELQLVMDFGTQGRCAPEESLSLGSVMRPLSELHALASVTVEVRGVLDASTDADMIVLAEALPLLTTLQIHCRPPPIVASLSAAAIASFASRCPGLKTLNLPSIRVAERDLSLLANYPVLDHGLTSLHFSFFDSADGHFTALLLDRLFPRLAIAGIRPEPSLDEPSRSQRAWTHVCDILETLRIARGQHERRQNVVS